MTEPSRLEQEVAGIRQALNELLTNHIPHIKTRLGSVEDRGAFHTALILGLYATIVAAAATVFVTMVVK